MTYKEVASYYSSLNNGDKGRFLAYLTLNLGGSPHSWQTKILGWTGADPKRRLSPVIMNELAQIIERELWNC